MIHPDEIPGADDGTDGPDIYVYLIEFANKFFTAQQDIDPEIGAVVQKDLWEIL